MSMVSPLSPGVSDNNQFFNNKMQTPKISILTLIISLSLTLSITINALGQAPQGIPYQAVARDAQGNPMANQSLTVQFSLHEASADGSVVFQETQSTTTNGQGLFSLTFGAGVPSVGTFTNINWGSGYKFLQVQADFGNGYVDLGTQQLMSVPYALYAGSAGNGNSNSNSQGNSNYTPSSDSVLTLYSAGLVLPGSYTIPSNEYWKILYYFEDSNTNYPTFTANFTGVEGFWSSGTYYYACRYQISPYTVFSLNGQNYNGTLGATNITGATCGNTPCQNCEPSIVSSVGYSFTFPLNMPYWLSPGDTFGLNSPKGRLMVEKYK